MSNSSYPYPMLVKRYDMDEYSTYGNGDVLNLDFVSDNDSNWYGIRFEHLPKSIMIDLVLYYRYNASENEEVETRTVKLETKSINLRENNGFDLTKAIEIKSEMVNILISKYNVTLSPSTKTALDTIADQEIGNFIYPINDMIELAHEAVDQAERILTSARG